MSVVNGHLKKAGARRFLLSFVFSPIFLRATLLFSLHRRMLVALFFVLVYASPRVVEYFAMKEGKAKSLDARRRASSKRLPSGSGYVGGEEHAGTATGAGKGEGAGGDVAPVTRRKNKGGGGRGSSSAGGS